MAGLTTWSFLMATAHGAGLMVVPVFVGMSMADGGGHAHHAATSGTTASAALFATGVHAASYLAVTALVAMLVFEKLGVGILRGTWPFLAVAPALFVALWTAFVPYEEARMERLFGADYLAWKARTRRWL